ncbi:MAG TPA: hypothetical protein VL523_03035 [Terriglobia bacterium]|nr:hypothetical protein [Terriglobia bacterium]
MRADRVEVSWDTGKDKWLVRIQAGAEVIRRHCPIRNDADEQTVRSAALKAVQEEGFEPDAAQMMIQR